MRVQLPTQFDDPWADEQVRAGAEHMDLTQVLRLIRRQADRWAPELFMFVADTALTRLRSAHVVTRQDDPLLELWCAFYDGAPGQAAAWLPRFCSDPTDIDLLAMMVGKIDCRQDLAVIEAALLLAEDLVPGDERVRQWLMGSAVRDAITRDQMGLFNLLVQGPWISQARLHSGVFEGNALTLWALCLPEFNWTKEGIHKTLTTLLRAGVSPKEEGWLLRAVVATGQEPSLRGKQWKAHHTGLIDLLCRSIDENWDERAAMEFALNCALDAGLDWQGHDQGDLTSAQLVRAHPRWCAWTRKQALEAQLERANLDKTGGGKL